MNKLTDAEKAHSRLAKCMKKVFDETGVQNLTATDLYLLLGEKIDLINRQKAEIEKLERAVSHLEDYANSVADKVKAEAIKEFAERLQQEMQESKYRFNDSPYARACNQVADWCIEVSDNLVKEMVGESNAQFTMQNSQLELLREKCIEHQDFHKGDDGVFRAYISIEDLDRIVDELEVRS